MSMNQKWILIDNEKFYYEEVELFHGRKIMDPKISLENLRIFNNIMEKSQVLYGLFFGSLLGAIREKNFIEHDEDIDIYLLNEEREKFLRLLVLFKNEGLNLVRSEGDMLSLMRNNEYIDIYFFKPKLKFGFIKLRVFSNEYEYAAENLENPIKYIFLGINISIPNNPKTVIEKIYGKNWRTPLKSKHSEPNTIYNSISKMSTKLKTLPFYGKLELNTKNLLKRLGL